MNYTYYIKGTGEIIATSRGGKQPDLDSCATIIGCFPGDRFYVSNGEAKEKREFPVEVSGLVLRNVPMRTTAVVNGAELQINDGTIEVVRPGTLPVRIVLRHINYLTKEFSL